jgi:hypothetical protein
MAAATGASLRELMERMGHSSSRAALIYQHASRDRDEAIAAALGYSLAAAKQHAEDPPSGTQHVRRTKGFLILNKPAPTAALTWRFASERAKGIEPS